MTSSTRRRDAVRRALLTNPGLVPVEVVFDERSGDVSRDRRFLLKPDMTVGQFLASLRDRRVVKPSEGLFLLFGGTLPAVTSSMSDLYGQHQDEAGMLVCRLMKEKTFG